MRNEAGQFVQGVSGNPHGRGKGVKNAITAHKQELELAVRQSMTVGKITRIVDKLVELAEEGSVPAAKLLLDKCVSNARDSDEVDSGEGGVTIVIKNATFAAGKQPSIIEAEEAEFTEVK